MAYFRERHNLKTDYSGYQEVSSSLRNRLNAVCQKYLTDTIGVGQGRWWIYVGTLRHELALNLEKGDIREIIFNDGYDYVFEAVEIYLKIAEEKLESSRHREVFTEMEKAFDLSGSVYFIDVKGVVGLRVDKELAQNLEEVKEILKENQSAFKTFFDSVANLMSRSDVPENIIKGIFVAFENYLKEKTGRNDYNEANSYLRNQNKITATQESLLDKIYGYRSDAYAVAHSGNARKPEELDALWFLETVVAQLKFIDRKLKGNK